MFCKMTKIKKFKKKKKSLEGRQAFFPWSVNQWNRLPDDIVNIDDNLKFRAALGEHLNEIRKWF